MALTQLPASLAPVWPGITGVTLGAPVALSASVAIAGPMHGVIVAVTTPPGGLSERLVGGQPYYYRLGEVAFSDDNGDLEAYQYLGWLAAVYLPRTMTVASNAYVRAIGGAAGTVTPFTIP